MMKISFLILMLLVLQPCLSLYAQEDMSYGKKHVIQSKILDEERTYWVNLPAAYDDPNFGPEKYQVIYVWDKASVVDTTDESNLNFHIKSIHQFGFSRAAHGPSGNNLLDISALPHNSQSLSRRKKALMVINMGLKYHPKSPYLHEKLGAAYELNKEPQNALTAYHEALRLNPDNEVVKEKILKLKDQR